MCIVKYIRTLIRLQSNCLGKFFRHLPGNFQPHAWVHLTMHALLEDGAKIKSENSRVAQHETVLVSCILRVIISIEWFLKNTTQLRDDYLGGFHFVCLYRYCKKFWRKAMIPCDIICKQINEMCDRLFEILSSMEYYKCLLLLSRTLSDPH